MSQDGCGDGDEMSYGLRLDLARTNLTPAVSRDEEICKYFGLYLVPVRFTGIFSRVQSFKGNTHCSCSVN